jgi:hypothetical protein
MSVDRFPVEAGHILLFARSIGDPNLIYADEAYARGSEVGAIIAPPTFVQASAQFDPDYPLRPRPGRAWFGSGGSPTGASRGASSGGASSGASSGGASSGGASSGGASSGGASSGGGGTGLHAEQHYEYHRPLRAGEVLSATTRAGESWEKQGKRAGKLIFSESITEFRDADGQLVVTARQVGVRTERPVEG